MTATNLRQLSSDYLYTYTSKLNNVKLMLKYGLRYSLNKEKLPYRNSEQQNYIVCFCDILPEQSGYHRSVYGSYGLAFKKNWGIDNHISPMRYIHKNSIGASQDYYQMKGDLREVFLDTSRTIDSFLSLVLHSTARERCILTKDSIYNESNNPALEELIKDIEESFEEKRAKYGDRELMDIVNKWILPILHVLEKSVDELERRDAFLRIYKGDFRHTKDKVFYDEREWRSVKFITESDRKADPLLPDWAKRNAYLPESFNLKFKMNDLIAILVKTDQDKTEMKRYVIDQLEHLQGAEKIVMTFDEHMLKNY